MKEKVIANLNELFAARAEFYAYFDENVKKIGSTEVFDFDSADAKFKDFYTHFYKFDYAIRKLLPSLYKAYEIDSEKDLSKDF